MKTLGLMLLLGFLTLAARSADRVALVIGNSAYPGDPDAHPRPGDKAQLIHLDGVDKDRELMAFTLREVGFEDVEKANLRAREMEAELAAFAKKYRGTREVLFYFSGHGARVDGEAAKKYLQSTRRESR